MDQMTQNTKKSVVNEDNVHVHEFIGSSQGHKVIKFVVKYFFDKFWVKVIKFTHHSDINTIHRNQQLEQSRQT